MALQLKGLTTVFFIFYGTSEAQQLCHYGQSTSSTVNLNMDTTPILRQQGMCSCNITVNDGARISLFPGVIIVPNCNANIELVDSGFTFNCVGGKIPASSSYDRQYSTGEVLWLRVITTMSSNQSLSGSIQIKAQQGVGQGGVSDPKMTVECYEPNSNSILTTTTTTTTTSKPTTTTTTTTSKPTTTTTTPLPTTTTSKPATPTTPTAQVTTTGPHKTTQTDTASAAEASSPSNPSTTGQVSEVTTEMKTTTQSQSSSPLSSSDSGVDGGTGQTSQTTTPVGGVSSGQTDKSTERDKGKDFPVGGVVGAFVAGIAVTVIIISGFFLVRRCRKPPHTVDKDIPMSDIHPTYSGLTGVDKTVYDHITAKHTDYYNMATTGDYQNP